MNLNKHRVGRVRWLSRVLALALAGPVGIAIAASTVSTCARALGQTAQQTGAADNGQDRQAWQGQDKLIRAVKGLEKKLGFRRTRNFRHRSDRIAAYYRCYYTGKLELPESYEGLKLREGTKNGCDLDPERYDVFFYPIQAVASGKTPVTASLQSASTERLLVVVPHEDFHASKEFRNMPATFTEAASALVGFLVASEVARQRFGPDSPAYQRLSREPDIFLKKAQITNDYHRRLSAVYADAEAGEFTRQEALAEKQRLLAALQAACGAISPDPSSFNKCPAAENNAGLAFDMTYTKYYPLMYDLYQTKGQDIEATIDEIKRAAATGFASQALQEIQEAINAGEAEKEDPASNSPEQDSSERDSSLRSE